jgi:hypothetical protein
MDDVQRRYLDLLKVSLTRSFPEGSLGLIPPSSTTLKRRLRWAAYSAANRALATWKLVIAQTNRPNGESMLDLPRMNLLEDCIRIAVEEKVPGDFLEAGAWRGGASIFARAALDAYGGKDRRVFVADSFEGLPKPAMSQDHNSTFWQMSYLAVSLDEVRGNFERYGLLDERVTFLKGFFSDTMPNAPVDRLAVLRLDGDMYESTIVCLEHLYPKLSPGGFLIVDDYGCVRACAQAVHDYRDKHGITEPIGRPDDMTAYWRKPLPAA